MVLTLVTTTARKGFRRTHTGLKDVGVHPLTGDARNTGL
jgi:hypothetical protein